MILTLLKASASTITNPIWDEGSLLLANAASTKTYSLTVLISSLTNFKPRDGLSICHCGRLLRYLIYSFCGSVLCAAKA